MGCPYGKTSSSRHAPYLAVQRRVYLHPYHTLQEVAIQTQAWYEAQDDYGPLHDHVDEAVPHGRVDPILHNLCYGQSLVASYRPDPLRLSTRLKSWHATVLAAYPRIPPRCKASALAVAHQPEY